VAKDTDQERRCPGEKYAITDAVCRARRQRQFPRCLTCKWNEAVPKPEDQAPPVDLDKVFKAYDIRGLVDQEITRAFAWKVGYSVAAHLLKTLKAKDRAGDEPRWIVVGHDMRPTSEGFARAVADGLRAAGAGAISIGEVETPAVYYAVGSLKALGGIQVTASHNPVAYNGFKITGPDCVPVGLGSGLEKIKRIFASIKDTDELATGPLRHLDVSSGYLLHVKKFVTLPIRPMMKMVLDMSNGMASKWVPSLLREYNVQVEGLNLERAGRFKHEPNPLKEENLAELKARVRASGAALGACFDGDADRVGFVDEKGDTVPNDLITALLVPLFLKNERGATIVYDLRSSWALREEIEKYEGVPCRQRVGHSFLKAALRETNAPFGGELSGHSYYRDNFYCDSAIITLMLVLQVLTAHPQTTFSERVAPLRRYARTGEVNFEVPVPRRSTMKKEQDKVIKALARKYAKGRVDFLDGVTVEFKDWWFNVRPSNTEPLLRLCLEAGTEKLRDEKYQELAKVLGPPSRH
jgi:phosphomannomutase